MAPGLQQTLDAARSAIGLILRPYGVLGAGSLVRANHFQELRIDTQ